MLERYVGKRLKEGENYVTKIKEQMSAWRTNVFHNFGRANGISWSGGIQLRPFSWKTEERQLGHPLKGMGYWGCCGVGAK